ncbi:gram-negative bacteria binding protein 3 [Haematobia irritans]|uniref:gram-negative bacteria binding protein 3 n=1 Tax=Haematobia irritans TaxID=7368 RepID=UPI003F4F5614
MDFWVLVLLLLASIVSASLCRAYEVPTAKVEVFYPKGFQVSIPHEEGITLFAFHGKLNEEMDGLEAGTWARDIVKPKEGRWRFVDRQAKLKLGDTLYYWTYVIYQGLGYREEDGVHVVQSYVNSTTIRGDHTSTNRPPGITPPPPENANTKGGSCLPGESIVNGAPVRCAKQLVFEENFNDPNLDTTKWFVERRIPHDPDHEFCIYLNDVADVLKIGNGIAAIRAKSTEKHFKSDFKGSTLNLGINCTGVVDSEECSYTPRNFNIVPPFISGKFSTKGKFSFKYGSVEIRAKMPSAMWVYPQLWLEPTTPRYGIKEYRSGQMRLGQLRVDGDRQTLITGLMLNSQWPSFQLCSQSTVQRLDQDFHIYQLLWTSESMKFSVDNQEYCHFEIRNESKAFYNLLNGNKYVPNRHLLQTGSQWAPFDQEFSVTIGLGIGGFTDFPEGEWSEKKPWFNTDPRAKLNFRNTYVNKEKWIQDTEFNVDYIRIFTV